MSAKTTELLDSKEKKIKNEIDLQAKVEKFLINQSEEETNLTLDFAKALLSLDLEIKAIQESKKEIRAEAKAEGVSVQKVVKALNVLKSILKSNDMDLLELETIEEVLGNNVDIKTQLAELIRK